MENIPAIPESKIRFICGLSNGEDLVEGKGLLSIVKGEDSPWWKLQKYVKDNNLKITSFYLAYKDRHFVLPSSDPKFGGEVPLSYNCFRRFGGDVLGSGDKWEHYAVAEAIYEDFKVQLFVDEKECEKSWVNIVMNDNG
jgi:hypothetical protein